MKVKILNGEIKEGKSSVDIIREALRSGGFIAKVGEKLYDISCIPETEETVEILGFDSPLGREAYWHTTSHIMAQAVKRIFKEAKLAIGPPIEEGFYYDFDMGDMTFSPEDIKRIEEEMEKIIEEDLEIKREELTKEEAIRLFERMGEVYKVELINDLEDTMVSVYKQGEFADLCRGPHLPSTGYIKYFRLLSPSSSYWRGNERGPVLQRIYGVSYPEKSLLLDFIRRLEEAKERDHRKLGSGLNIFSISGDVGAGLILWHENGAFIRHKIEEFMIEENIKRGYKLVYTPHIGRSDLWERSGHLDFYRENMYAPMNIDDINYYVRPMNCPFHIQIYKSKLRSYRDLPIRLMELGTVYRYERSGVLHGMIRVRGFTQDDAHIFCRPDQVEAEVKGCVEFSFYILKRFGFLEFEVYLSTKPDKAIGTDTMWGEATLSLEKALKELDIEYNIDEGGGAFYGPKIDIKIKDALGRAWQCTTIQFDFNLPEKFDITYRDPESKDRRPYMVHRALLGSLERFVGVLVEHTKGNLPLWLLPIQVVIIPVSENYIAYAEKVMETLKDRKIRVKLDTRDEKLGYKIRSAEEDKTPYMIVVGKREEEEELISLRKHGEGDVGMMDVETFVERFIEEGGG